MPDIKPLEKYLKYTREQNLTYKIKTKDVEYIRYRYSQGDSVRSLAIFYGVCWETIKKYVDPAYHEYVKEKCRKYSKPKTPQKQYVANKRFRERKKYLWPNFNKWLAEQNKKCPYYLSRKNIRKYGKRYYELNKEKCKEYAKKRYWELKAKKND